MYRNYYNWKLRMDNKRYQDIIKYLIIQSSQAMNFLFESLISAWKSLTPKERFKIVKTPRMVEIIEGTAFGSALNYLVEIIRERKSFFYRKFLR